MKRDLRSLRILVVDDFAPMRKTVRDNLRSMGCQDVVLAVDGVEAVTQLELRGFDLVISDWNMPKMNGLDLLRHVRGSQKLAATPFMLVTAEGERDSVVAAIEAGVDQFLVKPFTQAGLKERIRRVMTGAGRRKSSDAVVTLARTPPAQATAEPAPAPASTSQPDRATVLVVDDTPTNIDVISGILKDQYRVQASTDGEKALHIARTGRPDLILLDIMMPDMDGLEVCRRLKQDPETQAIPVIFLTAKSETSDVTAGFEAGGVDYIVKPADPPVLEARVATHLRLKQARDDLRNHLDTAIENARLREDVERITRHDLKNPLAAIITTADSLIQKAGSVRDNRRAVENIRASAYDALGMVNRSLDLYKMETGVYTLKAERVDVVGVVSRVVSESRVNAEQEGKRILLEAPERCFVQGEATLCLPLFRNLIKNAVEASPPGAPVRVEVDAEPNPEVRIHNQGVIPESIRETFFEKYSTAGKEGGTGLGTYSAWLMARVQGGEIQFRTDSTSGTTLIVRLPPHGQGNVNSA